MQLVGTVIARCLPDGAFGCRFGGDEFVIALPGSTADAARLVANAIKEAVNASAPTLGGKPFPERTVSISVGVAVLTHTAAASANGVDAGEGLFHAADQALYAAKTAGRNQVSVATILPAERQHL